MYNESKTIIKLLKLLEQQKFIKKQIIIVDDCSSDNSLKLISDYNFNDQFKIIKHKKNLGKGASIKSAQTFVDGDYVIIQDADLEYDPQDYMKLLHPIISGKSDVVYGSRVLNKKRYDKDFTSNFRIFGNHILTLLSNVINKQNLTDAHTCYKVFKSEIFKSIELKHDFLLIQKNNYQDLKFRN